MCVWASCPPAPTPNLAWPCPNWPTPSGPPAPPALQATFEDSLQEEAEAKRHCTTSEAVQSGAAAGAYRTLLTHFSQRYPKIPVVDQNFQVGGCPVGAGEGAGACRAWLVGRSVGLGWRPPRTHGTR